MKETNYFNPARRPPRRYTLGRLQFRASPLPELVEGTRPSFSGKPEPKIKLSSATASTDQPASVSASPRSSSELGLRLSPLVRVRLAILLVMLVALILLGRLYVLQITQNGDLSKRASDMHLQKDTIPARRGIIRDANGLILASNKSIYTVYGAPQGLTEKQSERAIAALTQYLPNILPAKIREALTFDKKHSYNLITSDVDAEVANKIRALTLPGVNLESKPRRVYPNDSLLGPLLGFTNYENVGSYGIEGAYNLLLTGKPGVIVAERDREGNPIVLGQRQISDPEDGSDITLTIDSGVQWMVERELKKGMEEHQAEAAVAIVMDPKTGAILAWASFPNYNPNEFYKTDPSVLKDPVVSGIYEPGSTFKILTAAIGIDTGVVGPNSFADLPGCIMRYRQEICNYDKTGYTHQTVVDTLMHSSNVGAMWIAEKFGPEKYYNYLKHFGIGSTTGVDVQGEVEGLVRWQENKNWIPLDMLSNSFGQSVAVTPLQLVTAVSAVANDGKLMRPYVVSKIARDGKILKETTPQMVRQVIRPESAKITTDMLVQAVRKGETRLADVQGYRVAGKTGTTTLYDSPLTIGSTIAYAPADNPRFVVYVRFDKTKDTPWGSNSAAPVVKSITENLFTRFNIPPSEAINRPKQ